MLPNRAPNLRRITMNKILRIAPETAPDKTDAMIVTLNVAQLKTIIREEVKAALQNASNPATDRLIDIAEAAATLNLSQSWLYRNWKRLPFSVKVDRTVKFSEKGLQKWIEAQKR